VTIDVETLFTRETASRLLSFGLEIAAALGLPVTSWRTGDPSRTLFQFVADALAARDAASVELFRAGFRSSARGSWLTLVAEDMYGVTRQAATYATPTVTLTNNGGGVYTRAAGEVIVKASSTGATFRSTEPLALASGPGTSQTIALVADVPGSAGTVGAGDIDEIVSTMLGVTITASTAAVGIDEQSDASLNEECASTLGALSPNGPPDAYNSVALDSKLTGTSEVTRVTTSEDSDDGTVTVWIAGASGAVSGAIVAAVERAVELWATPACITPTVLSATNAPQDAAFIVAGDGIPTTAAADIGARVATYYATLPIAGFIARSALIALAHDYLVSAGASNVTVELSTPAADVQLAAGEVATAGTITVTEV